MTSRITAIADVFDALTSKRPYKEVISVEQAIASIMDCSGSQFDPGVVASFRGILEEILEIKNKYNDDIPQSFDIPEMKTLLRSYYLEEQKTKAIAAVAGSRATK